ncbi:MAG: class I SAM-dependent methyltransferase [Nanoarchaeota archaeon]
MNKVNNGWNQRKVNFLKAHGNEDDAFSCLVSALNIQSGQIIGDIMGGYGGVSRYILEYCARKGISLRVVLLDGSEEQLKKSYEYLASFDISKQGIERICADVRVFSLEKMLDKVVLKMGLHEVKKEEQVNVLRNIYSGLKPKGEVYVWESFGEDERLTKAFRLIVRKKDRLAGFMSLAQNRYFSSENEIIESLKRSGFTGISEVYSGVFNYQTKNLIDDFNGNWELVNKWNNYLRTQLPKDVKRDIRFRDEGNSISMNFTKKIFKAIKN